MEFQEKMAADLASLKLLSTVLLCFLVITSSATLGSGSPSLSRAEVGVLQNVAKQLGKTNWDFSVDPCSGEGSWNISDPAKGFDSGIACDCSFDDGTVCHVVGLSIKGKNLSGVLPVELRRLRHLRQLDLSRNVLTGTVPPQWATMQLESLDLSRNVLTGTVPPQWATMQLESLSLMANRLSGPFPQVLTKITTLTDLSIEDNGFNGSLPPEIGHLVNMQKFVISANEFSGVLPTELAKLSNLTDLRISSNNFSGRLPEFICNLMQLEKLHIQGCALEGPIPHCISNWTNLSDLRITDLKGNGSAFPDLSNLKVIKKLILRNCSIHGSIPSYVGAIRTLKNLDLSFNQLIGEIPSTFANLGRVDFMYLTGNMLTGTIPGWILKRNKNADISYNSFTLQSSGPYQCLQGSINAVESYSSAVDNINTVQSCLKRNFPCSSSNKKYQYELHINCGGIGTTIDGTKYEQDIEERGASMLFLGSNWAFSSTGNFMDNDIDADNYIAANTSKLSMPNSELYTRARLSPLSLTYYGLCMMNGNYTVKLHFAEIVFTDDNTFTSLGKRIFNVFIQRNMVLKDFDIKRAAGGSGKPVIKTFNASVIHNTLEIQFYWAGKGTTGIPSRGVYGPLISAISVIPNFEPPSNTESNKIRTIIMLSIPLFVLFLILLVLAICWRKRLRAKSVYSDLKGLDLQTGSFTLRQIKAATRNFDAANKIGEGGFGSVYKGLLSDGTVIAVKQLSSKSRQGNREFVNEIGMISALQHPNLVKLYGCCAEGNQLLLIYEYMENNCLARALFGNDPQGKLKLDWATRRKICLGIARGLAYLHEESRLKIVHRDIKTSNVLLDKDLNAKISDFGLAKLNEDDNSHISTRVAGTIGYMAPEYAMRGHLTDKADVYSFGVVALEIVSGKSNTSYRPKEEFVYLLDWACVLQERGTLLELVDPELATDYSKEEAMLMLNVGLLCTNASPTLRPSMSKVVSLLEGLIPVQPLLSVLTFPSNGESSKGIRRNFWEDPKGSKGMSTVAFVTDSSTSCSENGVDVHLLRTSQQSIN